jgi:HEAT repeat protein
MEELSMVPPDQFLEALKRRNLDGKRALIADLRRRKTDKAVEILVELLEDDSWYLRDQAVNALADVGNVAVPRLLPLLESGLWYTRAAAARVLGRVDHAASIPRLIELLAETNRTVQGAALASIADLVRGGHAVEAARAIWGLGPRRAEDVKRLLIAVHPDAGGKVAEVLAEPSQFLKVVPRAGEAAEPADLAPKNAASSA